MAALRVACTRCGEFFDPKEELGRWSCRCHPAVLAQDTRGVSYYPCCGLRPLFHDEMRRTRLTRAHAYVQEKDRLGCLSLDHSTAAAPPAIAGAPAARAGDAAALARAAEGGGAAPGVAGLPAYAAVEDRPGLRAEAVVAVLRDVRLPVLVAHVEEPAHQQLVDALVRQQYAALAALATRDPVMRDATRPLLAKARQARAVAQRRGAFGGEAGGDSAEGDDSQTILHYWLHLAPHRERPPVDVVVVRTTAPAIDPLVRWRQQQLNAALGGEDCPVA
jgi:hypothetical protein